MDRGDQDIGPESTHLLLLLLLLLPRLGFARAAMPGVALHSRWVLLPQLSLVRCQLRR